ncbi:hypothetical protein GGR58DRAFT_185495 [Xylaria digitata]|nr:hypothetical protein GGR58DRAFT_185495 [Xylaria digitata]
MDAYLPPANCAATMSQGSNLPAHSPSTSASYTETPLLDLQRGKYIKGISILTKEVESFEPEKTALVKKRKAIDYELDALQAQLMEERDTVEDELAGVRKRQKVYRDMLKEATQDLKAERANAGISDVLWVQYENFCASPSLHPVAPVEKPLTINNMPAEEFKGLYINYDPDFTDIQTLNLLAKGGNWRCDSTTTYTNDGLPFLYNVTFNKLRITTVDAKTWGERFSSLYGNAKQAAKDGSTTALEMLVALLDEDDCSGSGTLFEFGYEKLHCSNPPEKGQWLFRASHKLSKPVKSEEKRASLIQKYGLPFKVTKGLSTELSNNVKCEP